MAELTNFGKGGHYPGEWYSLHSIAADSKGNLYTVETYQGRRVQRFLYKGLGAGAREAAGRRLAGQASRDRPQGCQAGRNAALKSASMMAYPAAARVDPVSGDECIRVDPERDEQIDDLSVVPWRRSP